MTSPSTPPSHAPTVPGTPPSLYEWLGGEAVLARLSERFYDKVLQDELLRPLFEHMAAEHPGHVAMFLGEVLGGPRKYTDERGGHSTMIRHHLGKSITEQQRQRWVQLLLGTADDLGLPSDPEFRSAFVAYLEWGSRLAVINSALPADADVDAGAPMPAWGWGVPGGPYIPETKP
ncbi:MAG TPA: group II truncated hemoglobin [Acidisarcina sp.]